MKRCNVMVIEYTIRELERLVDWCWSPAFFADRDTRQRCAAVFEADVLLWHQVALCHLRLR